MFFVTWNGSKMTKVQLDLFANPICYINAKTTAGKDKLQKRFKVIENNILIENNASK